MKVLSSVAILASLSAMVFAGASPVQGLLAGKPYQQWTRAEANKVLYDSPWAKTQEARIEFGKQIRAIAGAVIIGQGPVRGELGGANAPIDYKVTMRLRSSLPVRQALVRLKQLDANYDKMTETGKELFDAKLKGLLDCPACALNYVVTLSCKSENYPGQDLLFEGLRGARLAAIKPYIYIANDRGEKRELVHFVAPKAAEEEAIFFFPRFDDEDNPLVKPDTKKLYFRLSDNNAKAITNFEIDVSKLIVNGEVAF
jgi:hypothetical protein